MLSKREREARRRRYRIQQRVTLVLVLLVLVLLVVGAVVALHYISETGGDNPTGESGSSTSASQTTTTTGYPPMASGMLPGIGLDTNDIQAVLVYDETAGQPVYGYDADRRMYPASMTKMMTAAVACEYLTEDMSFTVGTELEMVASDASRAGLWKGRTVSLRSLLEGLLMNSGGDCAYTLAVNTARKATGNAALDDAAAVAKFMELVNGRMTALGCTGSHFSTPDGYYAHDHYSTAHDMALVSVYARSFPLLKTIMGQWSGEYYKSNTNLLLNPESEYYYEYADGLKTGFHDQGGYCLAASATKDGQSLIVVILCGHDANDRFGVAKDLFEQAFAYIAQQKQ